MTERERMIARIKASIAYAGPVLEGAASHLKRSNERVMFTAALTRLIGDAREAIAALRAPDLRPWMQHTSQCPKHSNIAVWLDCTCGLNAALKAHDALPRP